MDIVKGNMGWIEVVVGPMFSGKSEELIRRLRRAEIARQRVQIFKPAIDERYAANEIVSHSGLGIPSDNVFKASEIMEKLLPRTEVIGIDESRAQEITAFLRPNPDFSFTVDGFQVTSNMGVFRPLSGVLETSGLSCDARNPGAPGGMMFAPARRATVPLVGLGHRVLLCVNGDPRTTAFDKTTCNHRSNSTPSQIIENAAPCVGFRASGSRPIGCLAQFLAIHRRLRGETSR